MNMEASDEQQASHTQRVIVLCPNCSQKLRTPAIRGKLRLICPKCKHDWLWSLGANITIQIERIKEKLERAKRLRHNPPLSSRQIDAWETKYNTCLPEEYRSFLEQIGNGGGLVHGAEMLRLEDWDSCLCFEDEQLALIAPSQPCLLLEDYQFYTTDRWEQWLVEVGGEDWEEKLEQGLWSYAFGIISIAYDQCRPFAFLVLNGALKGRIGGFGDWGPPTFESSATFLDWYELWLDRGDWQLYL